MGRMDPLLLRTAEPEDANAVAAIYNEGIEGREATFETDLRQGADFIERISKQEYPVVVAEARGRVVGCAWLSRYSDQPLLRGSERMQRVRLG
jgi:phosphinothricin acetyltransferase